MTVTNLCSPDIFPLPVLPLRPYFKASHRRAQQRLFRERRIIEGANNTINALNYLYGDISNSVPLPSVARDAVVERVLEATLGNMDVIMTLLPWARKHLALLAERRCTIISGIIARRNSFTNTIDHDCKLRVE